MRIILLEIDVDIRITMPTLLVNILGFEHNNYTSSLLEFGWWLGDFTFDFMFYSFLKEALIKLFLSKKPTNDQGAFKDLHEFAQTDCIDVKGNVYQRIFAYNPDIHSNEDLEKLIEGSTCELSMELRSPCKDQEFHDITEKEIKAKTCYWDNKEGCQCSICNAIRKNNEQTKERLREFIQACSPEENEIITTKVGKACIYNKELICKVNIPCASCTRVFGYR